MRNRADFNASKVRLEPFVVAREAGWQVHFNTSKVQLEERNLPLSSTRPIAFQYLEGAIRGIRELFIGITSGGFQYLEGAIRGEMAQDDVVDTVTFQYLEGAIRGSEALMYPAAPEAYFNTSKVQLEAFPPRQQIAAARCCGPVRRPMQHFQHRHPAVLCQPREGNAMLYSVGAHGLFRLVGVLGAGRRLLTQRAVGRVTRDQNLYRVCSTP